MKPNKDADKLMTVLAYRQAKMLENEMPEDMAPSEEFVERMTHRIADFEEKRHRKALRKKYVSGIAACLVFVVIVGFSMKLNTQANRSSIAEFFFKYFSISHTDDSWDIAANERVKDEYSGIYLPSWMPEGFEADFAQKNSNLFIVDYSYNNEKIRFMQRNLPAASFFDNEISNYESFTKNGQKYYYCEKGKPKEHTLIWEKGKRSFRLASGLSKEELIKIAESIVYKK